MLIEFSVGNYLSFRNTEKFSMVASIIREHKETHVFETTKNLRLLKSAIIYGANASGKSNLLKAISFMSKFVQNSSKDSQAEETIPIENFRLSTDTLNKPSFFEAVFIQDNTTYRYGFEVDVTKILNEWLFYAPKNQEVKLFERNGNEFEMSQHFKEGKDLEGKTRDNALFLSVVAQFNGEISINILKWFKKLRSISGLEDNYREITTDLLEKKVFENQFLKDTFLQLMQIADLGIEDIKISREELTFDLFPKDLQLRMTQLKDVMGDGLRFKNITNISTFHKKYDSNNKFIDFEEFNLQKNESHGTQKLFSLLGPILDALQEGKVLIIDEFDSRLHTLLTRFILNLFNSQEFNPLNAQLVVTTHDTNLLTNKLFRRDQVWFTEKDRYGSTAVYSLDEFKVRNDKTFEKDYLLGKYGAIPFIGEFQFFSSTKDGNEL